MKFKITKVLERMLEEKEETKLFLSRILLAVNKKVKLDADQVQTLEATVDLTYTNLLNCADSKTDHPQNSIHAVAMPALQIATWINSCR